VTGCCVEGSELSNSIQFCQFIYQITAYQLVEINAVTCSCLIIISIVNISKVVPVPS
jgi:hypothetical protein